jgi:tetratricopeptide (TPR) repeat protein
MKTSFDQTISDIVCYYHEDRTHLGLAKDTPAGRPTAMRSGDVCRRAGANALVGGSLARGREGFVISASAMNCDTGRYIAKAQLQAGNKDQVLGTIWKATADLRCGMGESIESVQDNDIGKEATTSSLEAFKAFRKGQELHTNGDNAGAVPFFKQAVELDPNFAMGYAELANAYIWIGDRELSDEATRKAFSLRDRTSGSQRLFIEVRYYQSITGETFKAIDALKRWEKLKPDEFSPHNLLAGFYGDLGDDPSMPSMRLAGFSLPSGTHSRTWWMKVCSSGEWN